MIFLNENVKWIKTGHFVCVFCGINSPPVENLCSVGQCTSNRMKQAELRLKYLAILATLNQTHLQVNVPRFDLQNKNTEVAPSSHRLHANLKTEIRRRRRGTDGEEGGMQDRGNQNQVLTIQITSYSFSGHLTVTHTERCWPCLSFSCCCCSCHW